MTPGRASKDLTRLTNRNCLSRRFTNVSPSNLSVTRLSVCQLAAARKWVANGGPTISALHMLLVMMRLRRGSLRGVPLGTLREGGRLRKGKRGRHCQGDG